MTEFLSLLCLHFLGDFYLQTQKIADRKHNKKYYLFKHLILYTLCFAFSGFWIQNIIAFIEILIIIFVSHFLIDTKISQWIRPLKPIFRFLTDQAAHVLVLLFISNYFPFDPVLKNHHNLILLMTILLFLIMPASILVDKLILLVNKTGTDNAFYLDEGTVIGILERLVILGLGMAQSFSSIGFVLAAKTLVRYGEFTSEGEGAPKMTRSKYLVGTLGSVLMAIIGFTAWIYLKK